MRSHITVFIALLSFWFLLSGYWTPLMVVLGVSSTAMTLFLVVRMQSEDPWPDPNPASFYWRAVEYHFRLLWDMLLSAVVVSRIIFSPCMRNTPAFTVVPLSQKTPLGKLVRANAITLTPGTISTEIVAQGIIVHTLNAMPYDAESHRQADKQVATLEYAMGKTVGRL